MKISFKNNLFSAISKFKKRKILVVGDLMLDLYIQGPPRSVSQEAPVIIVNVEKKYYKLGGAANAAENIKALGGEAYLAGVIGDHNKHDDFGRSFLQTMKHSKMNHQGIFFDHTRPTTLKMRIISQGQQIVRVDEEITKKINRTIEEKLIRYIKKIIPQIDTIFVSDYNKGVITAKLMKFLASQAKKNNKKIVVDPKPQNKKLYHGVDFITPNDIEISRMYGNFEIQEGKIISLIRQLKDELEVKNVLITRGARGMDLIDQNNKLSHIPSLAKKIVDVSGAGDTVAAAICMGINDLSPYEVSYLAALAAKISIEKPGTATVSVRELVEAIKG